MFEVY